MDELQEFLRKFLYSPQFDPNAKLIKTIIDPYNKLELQKSKNKINEFRLMV